jgi:acetyl esterase/lipase
MPADFPSARVDPPFASAIRRLLRLLLRMLLGLAALFIVLVAIAWFLSRPATPDAFYRAEGAVPAEPGQLLKSEPFTRGVPKGAKAWRILYTTTRQDGSAALASGIVMRREGLPPGPHPVLAWAHGTTGIAPGCAPSVMHKPFAHVPAITEALAEGWVFVATDYVGLGTGGGHAYLVGEDSARAVLDSVRAARRMPQLALDGRFVVWGHSQGGHSALWTAQKARSYAPDIALLGTAALAPASDLTALLRENRSTLAGKLISAFLVEAWSKAYPDLAGNILLKPGAGFLTSDIASRCMGDWGTLFSVAEAFLLPAAGVFAQDPTEGAFGAQLIANTPAGPFAAPVLIAQGQSDDLVLPSIQDAYVKRLCAAGWPLEYRRYAGLDHVGLVDPPSPLFADLIAWTKDRFGARPAPSACTG